MAHLLKDHAADVRVRCVVRKKTTLVEMQHSLKDHDVEVGENTPNRAPRGIQTCTEAGRAVDGQGFSVSWAQREAGVEG